MNVERLIEELSNHPLDKRVRFFTSGEQELIICDYDQDEEDNPTFFLCIPEDLPCITS